jgi:hypothetical protein
MAAQLVEDALLLVERQLVPETTIADHGQVPADLIGPVPA